MDPDMIRPRKCKPCPPPSPPLPPPSPKKEVLPPLPPPHGGNIAQACQHDCCKFRAHPLSSLPLSQPPPLWPWHPPPEPPSNIRNYWNDDLDLFSRMQRVESLEMGYRMNFRDPLDDFHEDHTLHRRMPPSVGHHQRHGPPQMLMGYHHGQPPSLLGHHRGQPPLLLGHHREPPAFYFPPPSDYGYQHGYENQNGCTIM